MTNAPRRLLSAGATCVALLCLSVASNAQDPPARRDDAIQLDAAAQAAAKQSLQTFAQLVNEKNFKSLGFETQEEVRRATLGEPMASYFVRLDVLLKFADGVRSEAVIQRPPHYIFPVLVDGQARSSVEIAFVKNTWKAVRYGSPQVSRDIEKMRTTKNKDLRLAPRDFFVVRVPALNVVLLGHRVGANMFLTPVADRPDFELKSGGTLQAEELFRRLQPAARRHDPEAPS